MKKQCPESFVAVGAASVALRHALFDLAPHFEALDKALAAAHPDVLHAGGTAAAHRPAPHRQTVTPGDMTA